MVDRKKQIENIFFILFMVFIIILMFIIIQTRIMGKDPSILGYRLYTVDSGSMSPTLNLGTLIIVKETEPKEITKGDIITYRGSGSSVVTHRVTKVENRGSNFITKGDANETEDPMALEGNKLIGKAVFYIPYIGYLFKILKTKAGLLMIAIIFSIKIILQTFKTKENKKDIESRKEGL